MQTMIDAHPDVAVTPIRTIGTLPALIHSSWNTVLALMCILDVGVGFIGIRNTIIVKLIPEEKQASYIGYGMMVMNVGAAVAGPVVGFLATKGWQYAFLFNILSVVPFLLVLFFLPKMEDEAQKADDAGKQDE